MTATATISALSPNTEADDAMPQGKTKYLYPEFTGWAGERYLKKILRQILPMALYRTWEIFVEHQANGNECYLGVPQLAAIAGRTSRTMQKNLAQLEAKHLMVERAERKVFVGSSGTKKIRAVVVKDFSNLYTLAHEYHEWLNADDYLAPDRAVAALIAQDTPLLAKLRRFDNYRRILYNQLPGPHPTAHEEDLWFTKYQLETKDAVEQDATVSEPQMGCKANKQMGKEMAMQLAKDSPKRIRETSPKKHRKEVSYDSDSPLSEKILEGEQEIPAHSESQSVTSRSGCDGKPSDAYGELTDHTGRNSYSSPTSVTSLWHHGQHYQHEKLESNREEQQGEREQAKPESAQVAKIQVNAKYFHQSDYPLARSFVSEISNPFGDVNPKGSVTRVCSILASASFWHPSEAVLCLVRAYLVARDTRTIRQKYVDAQTGRANRMPLFCTMFARFVHSHGETLWQDYTWQQMEKDIAADELLAPWWVEQQARFRELINSRSKVYGDMAPNQREASLDSQLQAPKHHISEVLLQQRCRAWLSQTEEKREERARYARTVITRVSHMAGAMNEPLIGWEHFSCGCPLSHKWAGKRVCALCFPDPTWSEEVQALIHSIVEGKIDDGTAQRGTEEGGKNCTR